ncbi:glycosyltransferase [Streptomyces sp. NPDC093595]|uniref:glycosyltransferase n=1 Tax=Streptomyces sp. NPDC093595 TaxID=3366045 RepID=UPI003804A5AF
MSTIAWIALGSLVVWAWLLLGQGFFWRTDQRLPRREDPARWPSVAVVVPARDEAEVLPVSLPSLLAQDYPGAAWIVLVDDGSKDGTGDLARALSARYGGLPLTVASPGPPEPGWTGKLWAVRHGIAVACGQPVAGAPDAARGHGTVGGARAAGDSGAVGRGPDAAGGCRAEGRPEAAGGHGAEGHPEAAGGGPDAADCPDAVGRPEYLLLTDADIAHEPDSLRELVAAATSNRLDLVSQMARLRVAGGWERLVVPAFVYFFAQLYPFRWTNEHGARTAAAAGGCMLLRTEMADRARLPESIRQAVIDDVSLARAVRRAGGRLWLGLAERLDSVRPYPRLADLWGMVSRTAYAQLRHNPLLLVGTVGGLLLVYVAPPAALCAGLFGGDAAAGALGGAAWAVMTGTYIPMLRYYRQSLWTALLLPVTAALYLGMTVDSAVQHHRGRGAAWKGRTYPRPQAVPERR